MSRLARLSVLLSLFWCAPALAEPWAFVINEGNGTVSIIDTKTDKVSTTFKVGERPRGLAVTQEGERAYASLDDGTIIERDMYSKTESGGAKLGHRAGAIDVSPDGKLLAAAITTQSEILLLDLAMMRVVTRIPIRGGKSAADAVFSPDGRWIYATAEESPEVHVIDVQRRAVARSIHIGPRPRGVAFLPDGSRAFIAAEQENEIVAIDVARQVVLGRVKTASGPSAVTRHPDGKRIFVSAAGAGKVQVIDAGERRIVGEFEVCSIPSSIAVTLDGKKLYVTCGRENEVWVYDGSTYERSTRLTVGVKPASIVIGGPDPPAGGTFIPSPRAKPTSS